jgi:hypothetical protein
MKMTGRLQPDGARARRAPSGGEFGAEFGCVPVVTVDDVRTAAIKIISGAGRIVLGMCVPITARYNFYAEMSLNRHFQRFNSYG